MKDKTVTIKPLMVHDLNDYKFCGPSWVAVKLPIIGAILIAMLAACGCNGIRNAAGQNTWAKWTSDGTIEISGDGTADFDVDASLNADGTWRLVLKTVTSREAIQGATNVAMEGFRAINALTQRISIPGFVGPPAPVQVARLPPEPVVVPDP